jgi:hypothetical protein
MVFICSLQVMEGDNKVVIIIEDWGILAEYAGEKLGFYQLLITDGRPEIRVQTGRVGFVREFENRTDPLYNKILSFCHKSRFINVSRTARDDLFFK